MMRISGKFMIAFLACTLAVGVVMAQTTRGDIQGRVVDDAGVALPGVTVSIDSDALIGTQSTVTDTNGLYKFLVLPPGSYTATYSLSSFQTREQADIAVRIGSTTRVDVIMTSAFTDEVVVTSESPLVDTTSTGIGIDLSSDFYLELPIRRDYTSVAQVSPGAQMDASGQTFYGSSGAENAYYIDGANTTSVEMGQQGTRLNFEFIDEVQVKTGSYSAEYGRATGSVINVITKSGGNEFHGDVFGYYDTDSLQSSLKGAAIEGAESGSRQRVDYVRSDYGADLGGYVAKDKLWFFAAYNRVDNEDRNKVLQAIDVDGAPMKDDILPDTTTRDLWAAKLTWRIGANHSLSGSAFGDPGENSGALGSLASTPLHYLQTRSTGGTNYSFNYDGIFGQNVVISARVAYHDEADSISGAGDSVVGYIDLTDPTGTGATVWGWSAGGGSNDREAGIGFFQDQEFTRDQYNADLSWFVGNLAGSHEFKVGYEFEDIGGANGNYNSGGQRIYRFNCVDSATRDCGGGDYYYRHRFFVTEGTRDNVDPEDLIASDVLSPLVTGIKTKNRAIYLQDTWQVANNLSLALGVRFGQQQLFNADGGISADIDDNVAPRLGFVWDFLGNGKSKIYAHWGKFYETIPMDIVIRSFGGEISIFSYNLSDDPNDVANDPTVRNSRFLGGGISRVDPNTKGQYLEEIVLGVDYEFASDWAAGFKYINRDLKSVIEDSLAADGDYFIGNPGEGLMTGTFDMGYAFGYNDVLHPLDKPTRKFTGYEFTVQKRFSNNFQFITSLLFSDLTGNYDGLFQSSTGQLDPNLNSAFDYADFQVNNDGQLSNDVPVQFKIDGNYRFDFGLSTGLSAFYTDGTPITAMGYSVGYNNWEYYLSTRGAFGRTDAYWEADLHFGYPLKLGSSMELNLLLDIFNVFNNQ
ncbi:MAG: TonB-dependent receptor domain-containing protein, partial [Thermoanaerobaculales bacterium]